MLTILTLWKYLHLFFFTQILYVNHFAATNKFDLFSWFFYFGYSISSGLQTGRELAALDTNKKMTNFERAILENRIARCHMHDLRAYLVHFGKDFAKFNLKGATLKVWVIGSIRVFKREFP